MIEMCVFSESETSFGHDMLCGPFKEDYKISFSMLIAKQLVIYKFIWQFLISAIENEYDRKIQINFCASSFH